MKRTNGYMLTYIQGIPYLLPYGQNIAEQRRGMRLNDPGVFLWQTLSETITREELLSAFVKKYEASQEEIPELEQDMDSFLAQLSAWGMLEDAGLMQSECDAHYFQIAGIHLCLQAPNELVSEAFSPFLLPTVPDVVDLTIQIQTTSGPTVSSTGGTLLIYTEELVVSEHDDNYTLLFPQAKQIQEVRLQKDGKQAQIRCHLPYREPLTTDLFHAIRLLFLYHAGQKGLRAVHSASLCYAGKAWLFSGSSGTGKSTHTNLWAETFDTPIINGDVNVISCFHGQPAIHGTPWCGTSGIADPGTYPLGGIVLLKQAGENRCTSLSPDEKALRIMQRMISPSWTAEMVHNNLAFAEELTQKIYVTRLLCTKEPEAAHYMKSEIDQYLRRDL